MHHIEAVLFDLDGTLVDTAPDFENTLNLLLAEENHPSVDSKALREHVSQGAKSMVSVAFQMTESHPDFDRLVARMLELYAEHIDQYSRLYPGLNQLLVELENRNIPWGVVTNKPERFTTPLLNGLKLLERSSTNICPDHVTQRKPDPEPLLLACKQAQCSPNKTIYIGDHIRDIEAGQSAGMITIAAGYGYINQAEDITSWQADHIVNHSEEILPLLQSNYLAH